MIEKVSAHPIISILHIKLDGHMTPIAWGFKEVMHKLLCDQHVVKDTTLSDKSILLKTDQSVKNGLHPTN